MWLIAAVALVAVVAGAILLSRGGGDGDQRAGGTGSTGLSVPEVTDPGGDIGDRSATTTTIDPTSGLGDPGGLGGGSSSGPMHAMPGADWSDEARTDYVEQCAGGLESTAAVLGTDGGQLCGCIYDKMAASPVTFAEFNTFIQADDIDPSSPTGTAFTDAITSCEFGIATGG
jgi:hypothetical protein